MASPTVCCAGERDRAAGVRLGTPETHGTAGSDGAESLLRAGRSTFGQGRVRIQIPIQIQGER